MSRRLVFALNPFTLSILSTVCLVFGAPIDAQPARDLSAFNGVPRGAAAAIVVPHLKRASDDLSAMLEGMDRTKALIGGRPVDQIRAILGLVAAVDESGPVIMSMTAPRGDAPDVPPLFIVPVLDARDFLESNFDPKPGAGEGVFLSATGETVHARIVAEGRRVVLSSDADAVASYEPDARLGARLAARLDAPAVARLGQCNLLMYLDHAALGADLADAARAQLEGDAMFANPIAASIITDVIIPAAIEGADFSIVAFNFDPLGLGIHAFSALRAESMMARIASETPAPERAMSRMPAKPFYFAASIDLKGLGAIALMRTVWGDLIDIEEVMRGVDGVQFAVSPSVLGLQGGLLNEAVLFLRTAQPGELRAALREQIEKAQFDTPDLRTAPTWQEARREIEGVSVDTYDLNFTYRGGDARLAIALSTLYGRGGLKGFVGRFDDGLLITFSQRPDVFAAAAKAAQGGESLADDPVLRQMRTWLPAQSDAEVFLGLGQFGRIVNSLLDQFRNLMPVDQIPLPRIDPATKPVGIGFDVREGVLECGIVAPADAMAIFFDAAFEQFRAFDLGNGLR